MAALESDAEILRETSANMGRTIAKMKQVKNAKPIPVGNIQADSVFKLIFNVDEVGNRYAEIARVPMEAELLRESPEKRVSAMLTSFILSYLLFANAEFNRITAIHETMKRWFTTYDQAANGQLFIDELSQNDR